MSQENVEIVHEAYDTLARRDMEAAEVLMQKHLAPNFEFESALTGQIYRGAQGMRDLAADLWETLDYVPSPEEVIDLGDDVVVVLRISGRGARSGAAVSQHVAILYSFEGDRVVRGKSFTSRAEALNAAGLEEQAMSQENVELVRAAIDAFNRGDWDAARDFFDPDVEVEVALGADYDGAYFGHTGLARLMRFWGAFGSFRSDIEESIHAGDAVVTLLHHRATGKRSGIDVEMRTWNVFMVRNGKVVRHGQFRTEAQALEAAGLREQPVSRNVENILQGIDAVNRQDAEAFVAGGCPDIEWEDATFGSETPRIYRGPSEVREWFNQVVIEPWESLYCEVAEIIEATDERVVWGGVLTARGKASGVETRQHFWTAQWFVDGKVRRRRVFFERDEALKAAGISE